MRAALAEFMERYHVRKQESGCHRSPVDDTIISAIGSGKQLKLSSTDRSAMQSSVMQFVASNPVKPAASFWLRYLPLYTPAIAVLILFVVQYDNLTNVEQTNLPQAVPVEEGRSMKLAEPPKEELPTAIEQADTSEEVEEESEEWNESIVEEAENRILFFEDEPVEPDTTAPAPAKMRPTGTYKNMDTGADSKPTRHSTSTDDAAQGEPAPAAQSRGVTEQEAYGEPSAETNVEDSDKDASQAEEGGATKADSAIQFYAEPANADPIEHEGDSEMQMDTTSTADVQVNVSAPSIVSLSPAPGSTDVSLQPTLSIYFSAPVSVAQGTLQVVRSNSGQVELQLAVHAQKLADGQPLQVFVSTALTPNQTYYVLLDGSLITSESGTPFAGFSNAEWSFTTMTPAESSASSIASSEMSSEASSESADE